MYTSAKMEVSKDKYRNPITQDKNKDGSPRYYTYGVPFFNYGLLPQTWEDPSLKSPEGYGGDNDPLDVMEIGKHPLSDGSSVKITSRAVKDGLHLSMGICSVDVHTDARLVNYDGEAKLTLL